jgi:hypothetical protein
VFSDLHGHHSIIEKFSGIDDFRKIDFLIVCGDLTHFGSLQSAEEILKKLAALGKPVLFVPGNCDPEALAKISEINGALNVHGRYVTIDDLSFLGVGGSTYSPFNTPFELSEETIKEALYHAYEERDDGKPFILISHSPPMDTRADVTSSGLHVGSRALREFITETKPFLVVCGHIHEARGTDEVDGSLIVNPGPAHRGFYAIIEVNGRPKAEMGILK